MDHRYDYSYGYFSSNLISFLLAYLHRINSGCRMDRQIFHNIDVREHGSGNAGTTNTIRVLGWKTGIPVLIIDLGKGWLATMLPVFFNLADPGSITEINLQILAGLLQLLDIFFLFLQDSEEVKALPLSSVFCLHCSLLLTAAASEFS